jgi:hypothetical protein
MQRNKLPDFTGKVVSLSLAGDQHTYAMESPQFETQAGKWFVVGTVPRGGSTKDWSEGVVCAVAWDQVSDYLVFDSADDYAKRLGRFHKHKRKP